MRLGAIQTALDRGYTKPTQHLEAEVSVYDSLGLEEQQALLAALDALDAADEPEPTSHGCGGGPDLEVQFRVQRYGLAPTRV